MRAEFAESGAVEAAFISHRRATHGVLQTGDCAVVAFCVGAGRLMAVVLNEGFELIAACIEGAGKIQGDVR